MASDFLELIETELARALRCVNRAGMLAHTLEAGPRLRNQNALRLKEDIRRALAIREAIEAAGIQLPPMRAPGEREVPAERPEAELTVGQIAAMAGVHRITAARWLQELKGPIGEKYWKGRRLGKPAVFTLEEVQEILRAGGSNE